MKHRHPLLLAATLALASAVSGAGQGTSPPVDFGTAPDGVSVLVLDGGEFQVLSVASTTYAADTASALVNAEKVAAMKAKAALARFLSETVSVEEFVERESVRVRRTDGGVLPGQRVRNTLVRIQSESHQFLRGAEVFQTETFPAAGGGGTLRLAVGVDSSSLQ